MVCARRRSNARSEEVGSERGVEVTNGLLGMESGVGSEMLSTGIVKGS